MGPSDWRHRIFSVLGLLPAFVSCNDPLRPEGSRLPPAACDYLTGCRPAGTSKPKHPAAKPYQACAATVRSAPSGTASELIKPVFDRMTPNSGVKVMIAPGTPFDAERTQRVRESSDLNPMVHACCYTQTLGCMGGRPFRPEGQALVADLVTRCDWMAKVGAFNASRLTWSQRALLAQEWRAAAQFEHASVASFARLSLQLLQLSAPASLLRDVHRAALDEVEHAELCFALAHQIDGRPLGPGVLPMPVLGTQPGFESVAVEALLDGCVEETVAAAIARASAQQTGEPVVREVLDKVAQDEQRHSELAFRILQWALVNGGQEPRSTLGLELSRLRDRSTSIAEPDRCAAGAYAASSLGRLSASEEAAIRAATIAQVVIPCVDTLLQSISIDPCNDANRLVLG